MVYVWSPSALKLGYDCSLALYYEKKMHIRPSYTLGKLAAGILLHKRLEKFYKEDGQPKYKSLESFVNATRGSWYFNVVRTGQIRGVPIRWRNKEEPFILANQIEKACKLIYERYVREEPPLLKEYKIKFSFNHINYTGIIDEIRKKHVLRDHKHSDLSEALPWNQVRFIADIQPTTYILGYSVIAHKQKWFRDFIGLNEEEKEMAEKDPLYMMNKTVLEYHDLINGTINIVRRTREDLRNLEFMANELENKLDNNDIAPNPSYCKHCKFNDQCANLIKVALSSENIQIKQLKLFAPDPRMDMVKTLTLTQPERKRRPAQFRLKFDKDKKV